LTLGGGGGGGGRRRRRRRHYDPSKHRLTTYYSKWRNVPEVLNLQQHCCEYLRYGQGTTACFSNTYTHTHTHTHNLLKRPQIASVFDTLLAAIIT